MKREPGKFLIIMVAWGTYGSLSVLYYLFTDPKFFIKFHYSNAPSWAVFYLGIASIVGLVSIIGIFFWKKWGVYLFFSQAILSLTFQLFVKPSSDIPSLFLKPLTLPIMLVGLFISTGLWFWAIYRKWSYFK